MEVSYTNPRGEAAAVAESLLLSLTASQQRMWFWQQMAPDVGLYNIGTVAHLSGPLEDEALCFALNSLVERHEGLRSRMVRTDGQTMQCILATAVCPITRISLGHLDPDAQAKDLASWVDQASRIPFDLERELGIRAVLIRLSHDEVRLVLAFHHSLVDGWSMKVLFADFCACLKAAMAGQEPGAPLRAVSFSDYASSEPDRLTSTIRSREIAYWRKQFHDIPPHIRWANRPIRKKVARPDAGRVIVKVESALLGALRCQMATLQLNLTAFMVVLAAWQWLLRRYSGLDTIVVGSPVSNRRHPGVAGLVAYLANTIALRVDFSGVSTIRELLTATKKAATGAYAHSRVPFEQVVDALGVERDADRWPLVQAMLVYEEQRSSEGSLGSIKIRAEERTAPSVRIDLALLLRECDGRLEGAIEFDEELLDANIASDMSLHFVRLLQALAGDPDARLDQIDLLSSREIECQQELFGRTESGSEVSPKPVTEMFAMQVSKSPDQIAVQCGNEEISYAELGLRSDGLARELRVLGVGPNRTVAILVERSPDLIVAMLAVLKSGGACVPLSCSDPPSRIQAILDECNPACIVTRQADCPGSLPISIPRVNIDPVRERAAGKESPAGVNVYAGSIAYLIYTSGSSGRPKGVMVTHANLAVSTASRRDYYKEPPARLLVTGAFTFDAAIGFAWWALSCGTTLMIPDASESSDVLALARRIVLGRVTHLMAVSSTYGALLQEVDPSAERDLTAVILGGEPLYPSVVEQHLQRMPGVALYNEYGPTEATVWSTVARITDSSDISIGKRLPHVEILVTDCDGRRAPPAALGELWIGGGGLAKGYIALDDETRSRFVEQPLAGGRRLYRTGDLVSYRADGSLLFRGRVDDQVKVAGVRIEPAEIEEALRRIPGVARAAVIQSTENDIQQRLLAFVEPFEGVEVSDSALRKAAGMNLPASFVPSAFFVLPKLPLLPSGKTNRRALFDLKAQFPKAESMAPRGPVEQAIWEIWSGVLKRRDFGVHESFFHLGGHSLQATQVISRSRQLLGVELPVRVIFDHPTIAGLASTIESRLIDANDDSDSQIPLLSRDHPLPVSFSQCRMWYVQQMNPEATAYNMPFATRLKGRLDHAAMRRAVEAVAKRHEAFRTAFVFDGVDPRQVISTGVGIDYHETDLRVIPQSSRVAEARRLFEGEASRAFNLEVGPLARARLVQIDEEDHAFLWLLHHAIGDQWSAGILSTELAVCYRAFVRGLEPSLPALSIQYADYATWQRTYYTEDRLADQLGYWRKKLAGLAPLSLPIDKARTGHTTFRGAHVKAALPPQLVESIKRLGALNGATPFMVLLACFKILLQKYSGQSDVAVGSPIANRTRLATEQLVGTLVNTLVMRSDLGGDPGFLELLGRVRQTALEAYVHQDLPFERLVEEFPSTGDAGRSPLVQVLFNVPNAPVEELDLDGLGYEMFEFESGSAQFDLSLSVDTEIFRQVYLTYSTDIWSRETATRALKHFLRIVEAVVQSPERRIGEIQLLDQAEAALLVGEWNNKHRPYSVELRADQLFSRQALANPRRVALRMGMEAVSYGDLDDKSSRLAGYLLSRGVAPGSVVGICLDRSPRLLVALLAVMKAGGAYVPLDPAFPVDRLRFMISDAVPAVILTERALLGLVADEVDCIVCIDEVEADLARYSALPRLVAASLEALAYVIYTSGSTGRPKGVEISHRSLANLLHSMSEEPGCSAEDILLAVTTLSFDIAGLELFLPLVNGGTVILASGADAGNPLALRQLLEESRVTVMQATPTTWRMLVEAGWKGTPGLRMLCGGEPLAADLARALLDRGSALWNVYGPTETTIWSTLHQVVAADTEISIGRPIANTQVYVLDSNLNLVPPGVTGEIYIGGDGVARGYRNRPELNAKMFVASPFTAGARLYRTGDLGRLSSGGRLVHLGRIDFQVKIRGFRIELAEIETVGRSHPAIKDIAVAARIDSLGSSELVAYVVPDVPAAINGAQLLEFLRTKLPAYMLPSYFVFMESLPLTANNKLSRRDLPEPGEANVAQVQVRTPPSTPVEVQLAVLWQQILGVAEIGVDESFFDLGGHSLKAVRLFADIEAVFGKRLPLNELYRNPTIAAFAGLLDAGHDLKRWGSLVSLRPAGSEPPYFMIPGVGGNVLMFAKFTSHVGAGQPVYGLQPRGLDGREEPFMSIPLAAAHYLREVLVVRPRGPYVLVGVCTGGVIAYEMARQLRHAGQPVVLVLVDTWFPNLPRGGFASSVPWHLALLISRVSSYVRTLRDVDLIRWPGFIQSKFASLYSYLGSKVGLSRPRAGVNAERVSAFTQVAISHYSVSRYDGPLLNITASEWPFEFNEEDTRVRWLERAGTTSKSVAIAARNSGRMFYPPHVTELVSVIAAHVRSELSDTEGAVQGRAPEAAAGTPLNASPRERR